MRVAWYLGGDMNPDRWIGLSAFDRACLLDALDRWIDRLNESGGSPTGHPGEDRKF